MIKIATFAFNPFGENTYILFDDTRKCAIIDAGNYSEKENQTLVSFIEKNDLQPIMCLNTHGHVDHVCGVEFVQRQWGVPFALHSADSSVLEMGPLFAQNLGFNLDSVPLIDIDLAINQTIELGNNTLQIIHTPGHTPGHISIYVPDQELLLTGDLLFKESIGRTDLPGGDYPTIMNSIIERVIPLGNNTKIFPGHGPSTTISHEIMFNPFISEAIQGEVNYKRNEN